MTTPGTRWLLPGGHEALEMEGSTRDVLRVAVIVPGWHWIAPPKEVPRALCEQMPSRYLHGGLT